MVRRCMARPLDCRNMTLERSLNRAFAAAVRKRRETLGLSQSELGRRMGELGLPWHAMTVARTESGARPIRLDEADALAQILNVPLQQLLQDPVRQRRSRTIRIRDLEVQLTRISERESSASAEITLLDERIAKLTLDASNESRRIAEAERNLEMARSTLDATQEEMKDLQIRKSDIAANVELLARERRALRAYLDRLRADLAEMDNLE